MVSKKQPGSEPDSTAGSHIPEAEKDILKGPSLTESHLYNNFCIQFCETPPISSTTLIDKDISFL